MAKRGLQAQAPAGTGRIIDQSIVERVKGMNPIRIAAAMWIALAATPAFAGLTYFATVSGYSDSNSVAGQKYVIAPEENQKQENSFEFREVARHVERALSVRGMVRVATPEEADVVLFVGYGIGEPKTEQGTYSMPLFGKIASGSSTTTGNVDRFGRLHTTTSEGPSHIGVTGSVQKSYSVTTFERRLRIAAVEVSSLKPGQVPREKWRVDVKSEGSGGDLRLLVPVMAYALSSYAGTDTGHAIEVKVKESSKDYTTFLARPVTQ